MPTLPDSRTLGVNLAQPSQGVASADLGITARASQQLGNTVAQIGGNILQHDDELKYAKAQSAYLQTKVATTAALDNDPNFQTHAQTYQTAMDEAKQKSLGMIGSPRDQQRFELETAVPYQQGLAEVQRKAFTKESDHERGTLLDTISSNRQAAITAADEPTRMALLSATQSAISGAADKGYLGQDDAAKLRQHSAQSYAEGTIEALPLSDQVKRLEKGQTGIVDFIPADKRNEMLMKSQRELRAEADRARILANQERAQYREDLSFRLQDAQASYLAGQDFPNAPTQDDFRKAFESDMAARQWQSFKAIQDAGSQIKNLYNADPAERQAIIQSHTPVAGEGFAEQEKMQNVLVQVNNRITQMQAADPAGYVAQYNPDIQHSLGVALGSNDPQASQHYAVASLAEQKRLGIAQPAILPKVMSSQIAATFFDQQQGGQDAAKLMDGLQQQWGAAFPAVYQQLAREDKLPTAALIIPNMSDAGAKERLARLSLVDDKVIKERLDSKTPKAVEQELITQMGPFWNSLSVQNGGENTYSKYQTQANKLALYYAANGKSPSDAAAQAYQETVGHAYAFGPTYRVPIAAEPVTVMSGADAVLKNLDTVGGPNFDTKSGDVPAIGRTDLRNLISPNYDIGPDNTPDMVRHNGSQKGNGYLGRLRVGDGVVATEISTKATIDGKTMDIPTLVPTLTRSEVEQMLALKKGDAIPAPIRQKAEAFAIDRIAQGKDVYAAPNESPDQRSYGGDLDIAPFGSQLGLNAEQAKKATLNVIKNNPVWVTNPDESGLILYAQGNNGLNVVRNTKGEPVQFTWQQLRNEALKAKPSIDMTNLGGTGTL